MHKRLFILLILCPLALAGCGEGSRTLRTIIANGYAAIGSAPFEPPLLYQTGQEWTGPDAELGKRIVERIGGLAEEQGNPKEIEPLWAGFQYPDLEGKLVEGEIDFVLALFGITEARKEKMAFSPTLLHLRAGHDYQPQQCGRPSRRAGRSEHWRARGNRHRRVRSQQIPPGQYRPPRHPR